MTWFTNHAKFMRESNMQPTPYGTTQGGTCRMRPGSDFRRPTETRFAAYLALVTILALGGCHSKTNHSHDASLQDDATADARPDAGSSADASDAEMVDARSLDASTPTLHPLAIDPNDPHSFTGMQGEPLLFVTHLSNTMMDDGYTVPIQRWYLDQLAAHHLNLVKIIASPDKDQTGPGYWSPYVRVSNAGGTTFGNDVWDLDQLDDSFFQQLANTIAYARDRNVYVQIQIWNHIGLKAGNAPWRWDGSPFNPDNCIQDTSTYGFPASGGNGAPVFYDSLNNSAQVDGKTLLDRQEELFDRVVLATKDYPNVFYELGLEVTMSDTAWARHWVDRLHSQAPGKLIIVDTSHYSGDASFFDGYTVHQVSVDDDSIPSALYALGKMGIEDTDFDCDWAETDLGKSRRAAWRAVLSRVGFTDFRCENNLLDGLGSQSASWVHPEVVETLERIVDLFKTNQIPFDQMQPNDAMGTDGVEVLSGAGFVVAYTTGSDFTLTLPDGTYDGLWFDPTTGNTNAAGSRNGGAQTFSPPSNQEWVLLLHP